MSKVRLSLVFILIAVSSANFSVAATQSVCQALLQYGVFDEDYFKDEHQRNQWMVDKLCRQTYQTEKEFDEATVKIGLPVVDTIVNLGGSAKHQNFKEWYEKFCQYKALSDQERRNVVVWSKHASEVLAAEFNECIKNTNGFTIRATELPDPYQFRIRGDLRPNVKGKISTTVRLDFDPTPVRCKPFPINQLKQTGVEIGLRDANEVEIGLDVVCTVKDLAKSTAITVRSTTYPPNYLGESDGLVVAARSLPDIYLPSFAATNLVGVKSPVSPINPLRGYDALTDAYNESGPITTAPRSASWTFPTVAPGVYKLNATYAAFESRPLDIYVNEKAVLRGKFNTVGTGWFAQHRIYSEEQGTVNLISGNNTITITTAAKNQSFPHVDSLILTYVGPSKR